MLGSRQERWLEQGLASSAAIWDVLGQGVVMSVRDFDASPDEQYSMDSWLGYPAARQRLIDTLAARDKRNTVVLTGDVHANWVGQLHAGIHTTSTPCLATEFVGTSISSGGDGSESTPQGETVQKASPQIRYFNNHRGYVRCEVTPQQWRTDFRTVDYVSRPGAPVATKASFAIEPRRLEVEKA